MTCNCNKKLTLYFKKVHELAQIPEYKTDGASGMDVRSVEDLILKAGEFKVISTGLIPQIPKGYEIQVRPRSGLAAKNGVTVLNTPGTVDADYTGVIGVILVNHSKEDFHISVGDRIAQLVLCRVQQAEVIEVQEIEETERGAGGFGSTGVK